MAETDVKGLIERLRRRSNISRVRARGFDADAMRDAADALAALSGTREAGEPVAWRVKATESDGRTYLWLTREDGASAALSCKAATDNGETVASQIAKAFAADYAAPPAEVERGAVADETVRLACPQCDFGIGLHEPGCGQLPAALASPTPAQQATVEDDAIAEEIVAALFKDLRDRRFLKWLVSEMPTTVAYFEDGTPLDSLDADVQDEIRAAWREIIRTALKGSNQ